MSVCVKIKGKNRKICIADLDREINIQNRSIQSASIMNVDFDEDFSGDTTHWAMIESVNGEEFFDGTNTGTPITHHFYIRYDPAVTSQQFLTFEGDRYDILNVEDLDLRHEFQKLRCIIMGDEDKRVNFA